MTKKNRAATLNSLEHYFLLVNRYCTGVGKHTSDFIWENDVFPGFPYDRDQSDKTTLKRRWMEEEFLENAIYSYMFQGKGEGKRLQGGV